MSSSLNFQNIILRLKQFWADQGCLIWSPHHESVGAGTGNPATFLRVLGPEPWNVAYEEPSFRADDGRYADSPNRMQMHFQFQVILKPPPANPPELYLESLEAIGLDLSKHDVRFVEDNWESPALGAWGLGWEVWLDGLEISQFTYFQQCGGVTLDPPACEMTYGLERIATYLQGVDSVWELDWNGTLSYADVLKSQEIEYCRYNFEQADTDSLREMYALFEKEANQLLDAGLPIPAYDYILRCSHTFNILDARGVVGVAERVKLFGKMRAFCKRVATAYIESRESLGFPMLPKDLTTGESPNVSPVYTVPSEPRAFVLEIGTEELTPDAQPTLSARLARIAEEELSKGRFVFENLSVESTPRRIALRIGALSPNLREDVSEVFGPAKEICEKNPKALEGFCKRNGVEPSDVEYRENGGKLCAFAKRVLPAESIAESFPQVITKILSQLRFEKEMRWLGTAWDGEIASKGFNRPVRWLVALHGEEIVPVEFHGVVSSDTSRGPRFHSSKELEISSAEKYLEVLEASDVVLAHRDRVARIEEELERIASEASLSLPKLPKLVEENAYLTEMPTPFVGNFEERFTKLPDPVLSSVIGKHVRCFPLHSGSSVANRFIGVSNGREGALDTVASGFERVVKARFLDAEFFIEQDEKSSIEDFVSALETLTFHDLVGSYREKLSRLTKVASCLENHEAISGRISADDLQRSFAIAKFDLASHMVTEMTSLQGKIAGIYAKERGENEEVCSALRDQYLPQSRGDESPSTLLGKLLAIADKLDSVCALLSVGLEPTGSADPFAMRRDAFGALYNLIELDIDLSLSELVRIVVDSFEHTLKLEKSEVCERAVAFIVKRFEVFLSEEGYEADLVRSVLSAPLSDYPRQAMTVLKDLKELLSSNDSLEAFRAYNRCLRLLSQGEEKGFRIQSFSEISPEDSSEDRSMFDAVSALTDPQAGLYTDGKLAELFSQLNSGAPKISAWFDSVMIMAEDENERALRLGLIAQVANLLTPYLNTSELEGNRFEVGSS